MLLSYETADWFIDVVKKLFGIRPQLKKNPQKFLVIKLDKLGDIAMALPFFENLKKAFPKAQIDVACSGQAQEVLKTFAEVDRIFVYQSGIFHTMKTSLRQRWKIFFKILGEKYDGIFNLRGSFMFLPLAILRTRSFLTTHYDESLHGADRVLRPLEELGVPIQERSSSMQIPSCLHDEIDRWMMDRHLSKDSFMVGVHLTAGWRGKQWNLGRFCEILRYLADKHMATAILFGALNDKKAVEAIEQMIQARCVEFLGEPIPYVAAMIEKCRLLIGNDSSLIHVAAAVDTPVLVLWGPEDLKLALPKKLPKFSKVVCEEVPCRPCTQTVCPYSFLCMEKITVEKVKSELEEMIHEMKAKDAFLNFPTGMDKRMQDA